MAFFDNIREFLKVKAYRTLTLSTISVVLSGTAIFHFVERWRWLDSLYYTVITLTTVGYGDFSPQTDIGKIVSIVYILIGIGTIFAFIDAIYKHRLGRKAKIREKIKKRNNGN